jgi:hypothetical protein
MRLKTFESYGISDDTEDATLQLKIRPANCRQRDANDCLANPGVRTRNFFESDTPRRMETVAFIFVPIVSFHVLIVRALAD